MKNGRLGRAVMCVTSIHRGAEAGDGADGNDFSRALRLHNGCDGVHAVDGAVVVHFGHQMQQRGFQRARLGIDRAASAAAGIAHQDVDAAPGVHDFLDHGLDRFFVGDVHLDPDGLPAAGIDFIDRAVAGHGFGLGLEFFVRSQVEVGDRDFRAEAGEAAGVGAPEAATRAGDDGDFAVEFSHGGFLPSFQRSLPLVCGWVKP